MDRRRFLKNSSRVASLSVLLIAAGCATAQVTPPPNTANQPSPAQSVSTSVTPSGVVTSNPGLSPLPPSPVASGEATSGGSCSPLASVTGPAANTVVKGYLPLATTLSCADSVATLQYMYRYLPTGELTPIGGNQTAANYRFELNTSVLTDGSYELVSKVTLTNGQVLFSAPLKLQISNSAGSSPLGGGGGGGGGGGTGGGDNGGGGTTGGTGNLQIPLSSIGSLVTPGNLRWNLDLGLEMSSTPVVASNGNILFAADNVFYTYSSNGTQLSNRALTNNPDGSPAKVTAPVATFGNRTYLFDDYGRLHRFTINEAGGISQYSVIPITGAGVGFEFNAPAIDCHGNVYIHGRDRVLYSVDPQGTKRDVVTHLMGQTSLGFARYASPIVDVANNRVYTGSQQGLHVVTVDTSGGFPTYSTPITFDPQTTGSCRSDGCNYPASGLDRSINSPLAMDQQGNVYVTSETGTLYKLVPGASSFTEAGKVFVGDGDNAPVIGSDGTVYLASEDGRLRALRTNPDTGEFETAPGWPVTGFGLGNVVEFSSPVIGAGPNGDVIYVGTEAGLLWGINGTNNTAGQVGSGAVIQELEAPIRGSLTLSNDGTLYASTLDGRMFGVLTESSGLAPNAQWSRAQGNNNGTGTFKIGSTSANACGG